MVIMASGNACACVRTTAPTTTAMTESRNMAAIDMQQWLITVYFSDIRHPCYDQLTPVKTRYLLTGIT